MRNCGQDGIRPELGAGWELSQLLQALGHFSRKFLSPGLGSSFRSKRNGITELLQPPDMVSLDAARIQLVEVVVT